MSTIIMPIIIFIVFVSPVAVIYFAIKILTLKKKSAVADEESLKMISKQIDKSIIGFVIATGILVIPMRGVIHSSTLTMPTVIF
jgi:hypothetical protein